MEAKPVNHPPDEASQSGPAPARQRLFLALWPDDDVRDRLEALIPRLLRGGDGRRVRRENLHATLVFLGAVDADTRECVEQVASSIDERAFSLILDHVDHRPKQGIVWVAASRLPEPLTRLAEGLKTGLIECGLRPEHREYRVHITLARKVRRVAKPGTIDPIAWYVDSFVLVESHTRASGARYQVLGSWALAQ